MSCGCVPVVTDIPSFRQITRGGETGLLFDRGDSDSLLKILLGLGDVHVKQFSQKVKEQFEGELSFKAIARQLVHVCENI